MFLLFVQFIHFQEIIILDFLSVCNSDVPETMCHSFDSTQWVAGLCVSIKSGPQDFYEAALTCYQSQGRLLAVRKQNVYYALLPLLDQTKSYFFALTDEEWVLYPDGR